VYGVAGRCGLGTTTVRSIIKGETWRELDRPNESACAHESPPAAAPAAPKPEVKVHEWHSRSDEPRMFARGSGSRHDDFAPPPPLLHNGCLKNEHSPEKGGITLLAICLANKG
jgi:hypothetical protein